jgi:hypothetical protein
MAYLSPQSVYGCSVGAGGGVGARGAVGGQSVGDGETMRVTINIPQRVVYVAGRAHDLSRAGVNRLFLWLMDNERFTVGVGLWRICFSEWG